MRQDLLLVLLMAYLYGSLPFGFLVGKWWGKVDIRQRGSGNIGTTNVLRTVGPLAAVVVLLLDISKGIWPVYVGLIRGDLWMAALGALAGMIGHNWPVFLRFRGGKGVATGVGALIALSPESGLVAIVFFVVVVALTRYVSAGSIIGGLSALGAVLLFGEPAPSVLYTALAVAIIIYRHRSNIQRLMAGTENKLGQRA